ncbi:hypothetical protein BCR32DRAFT_291143 [Anaeromyces robustus]|uniref:Uncharacterized protein n=1 Tax=Anaeromyces robustus TaxID=1754192 RepID=A0A1Y1XGD3_9FUNG|nr:hypothetical protein BCR32DRAFT_291143 [Anaeromyces robustus]|eukprot:ORX84773.1 hypothetical protein BCR32DRAFT_291143 [Anaeromyces robustus]
MKKKLEKKKGKKDEEKLDNEITDRDGKLNDKITDRDGKLNEDLEIIVTGYKVENEFEKKNDRINLNNELNICLNGDNFEVWHNIVMDTLYIKKLNKYAEKDIVKELKENGRTEEEINKATVTVSTDAGNMYIHKQ